MNKRWVLKKANQYEVDILHQELNINRTLCELLVQRGIKTYEQAKKFFRPSLKEHLYDPFLMKDMEEAVERIDRAVRKKEKILIYGDYDVDGTTAVALVYTFFKEFYFYLDYYVPNRYTEGYGVSYQGIEFAEKNGFSLIISLDCGIKAVEKIAHAKERGIDFIVCDHHRPDDVIPDAVAVLDPKRPDCPYPYKELSGCGIGFKLVQAFAQRKNIEFRKVAKLLDLVAVSIAADIVPITDENRVLAYYGLRQLNKSPRPGFRSLIEMNSLSRPLSVSDVVFSIAPRINAAGRMQDAKDAVKLLVSPEVMIANLNADVLQKQNSARKAIDSDITEEAIALLDNNPEEAAKKSTVLYQRHWHKGVIGIVASRLIEKYHRPTIVLTHSSETDEVSGSARSVPGFDIYNAIKECSELLEQFGGHKYAAGLTLKETNVPAFMKMFEEIVAATIEDHMLVPEIRVDAIMDVRNINPKFYRILRQFAPFGPGNLKPVFMSTDLIDTGWSSVVGKKHLKLYARQETGPTVKGIGFNIGHLYPIVADRKPFDACFAIEENVYNGNRSLQMRLKDIKPAGNGNIIDLNEGSEIVEAVAMPD